MAEPTLTLSYSDSYLAKRISVDEENQAIADVAVNYDAYPTDWKDRLAVIRAYILCCQNNQAKQDDAFSVKLATYSKEFERVLGLAKAAYAATLTDASKRPSLFSIRIERA